MPILFVCGAIGPNKSLEPPVTANNEHRKMLNAWPKMVDKALARRGASSTISIVLPYVRRLVLAVVLALSLGVLCQAHLCATLAIWVILPDRSSDMLAVAHANRTTGTGHVGNFGLRATTTVGIILPCSRPLILAPGGTNSRHLCCVLLHQRSLAATAISLTGPNSSAHKFAVPLAILLRLLSNALRQRGGCASSTVGIVLPYVRRLVLAVVLALSLGVLCQAHLGASLAIWVILPDGSSHILAVAHANRTIGTGHVGNFGLRATTTVGIILPCSRSLILAPGGTNSWHLCCVLLHQRSLAATAIWLMLPYSRANKIAVLLAFLLRLLSNALRQGGGSASSAIRIVLPHVRRLVLAVVLALSLGVLCQAHLGASLAIWVILPDRSSHMLAVAHANRTIGTGHVGNFGLRATTTVGIILPCSRPLILAPGGTNSRHLCCVLLHQRSLAATAVSLMRPHRRANKLAVLLAILLRLLSNALRQRGGCASSTVGIVLPYVRRLVLAVVLALSLGVLCQAHLGASLAIWVILPDRSSHMLAVAHANRTSTGHVGNFGLRATTTVGIILPCSRPLILAPSGTNSGHLCCKLLNE